MLMIFKYYHTDTSGVIQYYLLIELVSIWMSATAMKMMIDLCEKSIKRSDLEFQSMTSSDIRINY